MAEHRKPFFEDPLYFFVTPHYPGRKQTGQDSEYISRGLKQIGHFVDDYFRCLVNQQNPDARCDLSYALRRHQFASINEFVDCVLADAHCMRSRPQFPSRNRTQSGGSDRTLASTPGSVESGDDLPRYQAGNPLDVSGMPHHRRPDAEAMDKLSMSELAVRFVSRWKTFHSNTFETQSRTEQKWSSKLYTPELGMPGLSQGHNQADEYYLQALYRSYDAAAEPDASGFISSATINITDPYNRESDRNGAKRVTLDDDIVWQMLTLAEKISLRWMDIVHDDLGVRTEALKYTPPRNRRLSMDVLSNKSVVSTCTGLASMLCFLLLLVSLILETLPGSSPPGPTENYLRITCVFGMFVGFISFVVMKQHTSRELAAVLRHVDVLRSTTLIPPIGAESIGRGGRKSSDTTGFEKVPIIGGPVHDGPVPDYQQYAQQRPRIFSNMRSSTNGQLTLSMDCLPGASSLKLGVRALLKSVLLIGLDSNDIVFFWNTAAEELTGIAPEDIYGRSIFTIVSEIDRATLPAYLDYVRVHKKTPPKGTLTLCTPEQGNVEVMITATRGIIPESNLQPLIIMGTPPAPRTHDEPLKNIYYFYQEQLRSLSSNTSSDAVANGMPAEMRLLQVGSHLKRMQWPQLMESAKLLVRPKAVTAEELLEKVMRESMTTINNVTVAPELQRQYIQCQADAVRRAIYSVMLPCKKKTRSVSLSMKLNYPNTLEVKFEGIQFRGRNVQKTTEGVSNDVNKAGGLLIWMESTKTALATFPIILSKERPPKEQSFDLAESVGSGEFSPPGQAVATSGTVLVVEKDTLYRSLLNRLLQARKKIVIEVNTDDQMKAVLDPGKLDDLQCAFVDHSKLGEKVATKLQHVVSLTVVRTPKSGEGVAPTGSDIEVDDLEIVPKAAPVAPWFTKPKAKTQTQVVLRPPFETAEVDSLLHQAAESHNRFTKERLTNRTLNAHKKPQYEKMERIGEGNYGVVHRVELQNGGTLAMKSIRFSGDKSSIVREVKILIEQDHPHIVRLEHCEQDENEVRIFMEYCEGGTMKEFIDTTSMADPVQISTYVKQLLRCLQHLHQKDILHLDIKPQNILFNKAKVLKVADFGTASIRSEADARSRETVGTGKYIAPELLLEGTKSAACDVWSVGIVTLEMFKACPSVLSNDINRQVSWIRDINNQIEKKQSTSSPAATSDSVNASTQKNSPDDGFTEYERQQRHCYFTINFGPLPQHLKQNFGDDYVRYLKDAHSFVTLCCAFEKDKRPDVSKLLLHPFITSPPVKSSSPTGRMTASSRGSVRDVVGKSSGFVTSGMDNDDIPKD